MDMCLERSFALEDYVSCVACGQTQVKANDEQEHVEDEHHHRRNGEHDGAAHWSLPGDWCDRDHAVSFGLYLQITEREQGKEKESEGKRKERGKAQGKEKRRRTRNEKRITKRRRKR